MLSTRPILTLLFAAMVLSAETDYRFAFPQSEILLGVDLKWMLKSPLADQLKGQIPGDLNELNDFKAFEGLLDQIESVYLSAVSKPKSQSDVILMLRGKFEADKLVALGIKNGLKLEFWGKTKILVPALGKRPVPASRRASFQKAQFTMDMPNNRPYFAIYDSKSVLVGEEGPLRVALERMESALTPQANPLFERARNLESANDIWIVGNTAPLNLGAPKGNDPFSQLASQVRNFSIGMAARRNVSIDLQLQTTSPKAAAQMLDMARGVIAMAKATGKAEEPLPIDLDKALELSANGNILRAALNIEQSEIEKLMAMRAAPKLAAPAKVAKVEAAAPPKPPEPVRKTVMIYGLPGGPKEVVVQ